MTRLVDDLLDVSRITRSAISLEQQPLDVRRVVRAAVDGSIHWMQARRHELSRRAADEHALTVIGDEARLTQVVQNLLHNAAKYTPEGGRIEVAVRREPRDVVVVRDNGVGMAPELLLRRSSCSSRAGRRSTVPQGGLGVGLTLVQRLVQLHGGTVEAHSAGAEQGSEFVVRLAGSTRRRCRVGEGAGSRAAPRRRAGRRRQPGRRECAAAAAGERRPRVKVADDGVSGLALAREYKPEYLLLDIGLPRLSGYDIAVSVRGDPVLRTRRSSRLPATGSYTTARAPRRWASTTISPSRWSSLRCSSCFSGRPELAAARTPASAHRLRALGDQHHVRAAEGERVGHHCARRRDLFGLQRDVAQPHGGIRLLEKRRRRDHPFLEREQGHGELERAGAAEKVTVHRLGRAYAQRRCPPNTALMASASTTSPTAVAVPWALI